MLNKIILGLLIILLAVILYLNILNKANVNNKINTQTNLEQNTILNQKSKKSKVNQSFSDRPKKEIQDFNKEEIELINSIILELGINQDSNPINVIQKVKSKFNLCLALEKYASKFEKNLLSYSEIQKNHFKRATLDCSNMKKNYKEFSKIYRSRIYNKIMLEIIGETKGEFIENIFKQRNSEEEKYRQTEEITRKFLKDNNPYILENTLSMQNQSRFLIKNKSINNLLGSHNINYLNMINKQALTLISCQFSESQTCDSNNIFMLNECFNNDQACGLSVHEWFNFSFTRAHLDDIDIVVNYYLTSYL